MRRAEVIGLLSTAHVALSRLIEAGLPDEIEEDDALADGLIDAHTATIRALNAMTTMRGMNG